MFSLLKQSLVWTSIVLGFMNYFNYYTLRLMWWMVWYYWTHLPYLWTLRTGCANLILTSSSLSSSTTFWSTPRVRRNTSSAYVLSWKLYAKFSKCDFWLRSAPILSLPEGTDDFVVYCDASIQGLGCVLMQRDKVIAYARDNSRFMNGTTRRTI